MGVDLQKKKRSTYVWWHLLCHFRPKNDSKGAGKQVVTFFFFLEITPFFTFSLILKLVLSLKDQV